MSEAAGVRDIRKMFHKEGSAMGLLRAAAAAMFPGMAGYLAPAWLVEG